MSKSLPKIRTSMQMSRESVEALRSLCRQSEVHPPSPPLLPKKILKIPQFHTQEPTPDPVSKAEPRATISINPKKAFSVAQSPVSDPTYKPDKFQQAAQRYTTSQRRRSALGPTISQIFKEDTPPVASPAPSEPLFPVPALKPVSSDELDESSQSEGRASPVVKKPYELSMTPRATPALVRNEGSALLLEYSFATAKVLSSTRDVVKRHAIRKVPARLFQI